MFTRRRFLQIAGGTGGLVALAGIGRAAQVGLLPRSSEPLASWGSSHERGVRAIVETGTLAANPHDSQPWKFRVRQDTIDVYLDLGRALGPVDPFLRQMHFGIGCALENLVIGASAQGRSASVTLFPDPANATFAARLVLGGAGESVSAHAAMVRRRHTNRGPYEPSRALPNSTRTALHRQQRDARTSLTLFDTSSTKGTEFARLIGGSTEALIEDDTFMRVTDAWFRWTPHDVAAHRDGPSLDCAGLSPLLRIAAQLGPASSDESFRRSWLDSTRDVHLATAAAFGVVAVRDPTSPAQLVEAGRLWQRVHLASSRPEMAFRQQIVGDRRHAHRSAAVGSARKRAGGTGDFGR